MKWSHDMIIRYAMAMFEARQDVSSMECFNRGAEIIITGWQAGNLTITELIEVLRVYKNDYVNGNF